MAERPSSSPNDLPILAEILRGGEGPAPKSEFPCRHCGARNRIAVSEALEWPERARCGRCREQLFLAPDEPLTAIHAQSYEHELDRKTLSALQAVPGLDRLLKWLMKELGERSYRLFNMASYVRCGPRQFPKQQALFERACALLAVDPCPDLYVYQSPLPNAATYGVEEPFVMVSSGLLEMMDEAEVLAVFGHELGHWQANHVLYKTTAQVLATAASFVAQATLGLGRVLVYPLQLALLKWDRCSELTADRAALLVARRPDVLVRVNMKLAGGGHHLQSEMDFGEFVRQSQAFREMEQESLLNQGISLLQTVYRTHPFPVWRTHHLLEWAQHGNYLNILAGDYQRRGE